MRILICLSCCLGIASSAVGGDDCGYRWSDRFANFEIPYTINTFAVFDEDGSGPRLPALFVGGSFSDLYPIRGDSRYIVKWDGSRYSTVGGGAPSYVNQIQTLAVCDEDGTGPEPEALFVAPTIIGGCARWDGSTWSPCTFPGIDAGYSIKLLNTFDADGPGPEPSTLIAAVKCSDCTMSRVYQLVNGGWIQLGGTFDDIINDICTYDFDGDGPNPPILFVAGNFEYTLSPSSSVRFIARWVGGQWLHVASGMGWDVSDLHVCDLDDEGPQGQSLFVAGEFTTAGGVTANRVARWNGDSWSPLGTGMDSPVRRLVYYKPSDSQGFLYAFGSFRVAGGQNVGLGFAKWDGTSWSDARVPYTPAPGFAVTGVGGLAATVFDPDLTGPVPSQLYVGGGVRLLSSSGQTPGSVGAFDGKLWHYLASRVDHPTSGPSVHCMTYWDPDNEGSAEGNVIVAGEFDVAGDSATRSLATWQANDWSAFDLGVEFNISSVSALGKWDSDGPGPLPEWLVAAGDFYRNNDSGMRRPLYWDGSVWQAIPNSPQVWGARSILGWDHDGAPDTPDLLVIAGICPPGQQYNIAAAWNGAQWISLGYSPSCANVNSMISVDRDGAGGNAPVLFAGASGALFNDYDTGEFVPYLGWWDGVRWQPLGLPPSNEVRALLYDDPDGSGPDQGTLYVAGKFTQIGGITANRIAAFDFNTNEWRAIGSIGSGTNDKVNALAMLDEDGAGALSPVLVAGGYFSVADGQTAYGIAKWDGASWSAMDGGVYYRNTSGAVFTGQVESLLVLPGNPYPRLLAGGQYIDFAGNVYSGNIACWERAETVHVEMLSETTVAHAGAKIVLRASAIGDDPITYQWRRNGVPLVDNERITGSDKGILRIFNVDRLDEGSYDVVATNDCSESVSTAASLIVPCFTSRPDGDLSGDGQLDGRDIQLMVDHLIANTQTTAVVCRVDFDNSRRLDLGDIVPFAEKLLAP